MGLALAYGAPIKQGRLHVRKLILITVLMLASASAFAGETRSLTLASNDVTAVSQPTVSAAAVKQVSIRLAQAGAPVTTQIQSDAPAQPQVATTTQAPAQTQAPVATTTTTPTTTTADTKPATAKPATKSA